MPASQYRNSIALALSQTTGFGSIAQDLLKEMTWRNELCERSLQPYLAMHVQLQQLKSSVSTSMYANEYLAANDVTKLLEGQQRLVRDALGPLAQLRAESIWEREHARLFTSAQTAISMQRYVKTISDTQLSAMESVRRTYKGINGAAVSIIDSLNAEHRAMIDAASRPFASIELFAGESVSARVLRNTLDSSSWIDKLKLPIIDEASASAVAKMWGIEGALREISSLGLDTQTMRAFTASFAHSVDVGVWEAEDDAEEMPAQPNIRHLSAEMWLCIFSVLLAILVPIWQKIDSDATEARLAAKVKGVVLKLEEHDRRSKVRYETLARIMERMMNQIEPKANEEVDFVVRSRVALIRDAGKSGSRIVAEVFPNQVVKLVSENGKWIEVHYFDWNSQEGRTGWALKKYFLRVNVGNACIRPTE